MSDSLLPDALMTSVCGPSSSAMFWYTSWSYRIVELVSGDRVNEPAGAPSSTNEMLTNVVVFASAFGRMRPGIEEPFRIAICGAR